MALADDVRELAGRSLAALDAGHDYFTFTKRAWRLLQNEIIAGRTLKFRNVSTGTDATEQEILRRSRHYTKTYLISSTFQHFVSLFEDFFFDLLRHWLIAYPGSLSKKQLEFGTVLKAADKGVIVANVVDRELNELKYERLADWFAYLERLTKLGCPTADEILQLAEIKASRDILVHNKGVTNFTYIEKSGNRARFKDGDPLELPEGYHRASWDIIKKVIGDVADAVVLKAH